MIDPKMLRILLEHDPQTGKLYWRRRSRDAFKTDHEYGRWNTRYAGREAFPTLVNGYRQGPMLGRMYKAHRVAWAYVNGEWPTDEVDHINGNREDNRLCNLRVVQRCDNMRNMKRRHDNASGVTGVGWRKAQRKWCARIRADGRLCHLGYFDSLAEAAAARKAAEEKCGYHVNHGRPGILHGVRREAQRRGVSA